MRRFACGLVLSVALLGCGAGPGVPSARGTSGELAARAAQAPAVALAARTLRGNVKAVEVGPDRTTRQAILAGSGHFNSLWARDGMYAAFGLLAIGEHAAVRDSLAILLDYQEAGGQVPRRVGEGSNAVGIIRHAVGLPARGGEHFHTADFAKRSVDANALVLWVAEQYVEASGDRAFLEARGASLHLAADWLHAQVKDGLLTQEAYGDWKDMFARGGKVMYSNALYHRALTAMAALSAATGDPVREATYRTRATALAGAIQSAFWLEGQGHYRDTTELASFSPEGDMLAVIAGLTTPSQRRRIFEKADALLTLRPLMPALDGDYPRSMVPMPMRLAGLEDYHDRIMWPWLTSLYAWAAAESGQRDRARRALDRVGTLALRDGTFHEIYEGSAPAPVERRFYASERDFSWSAGLFLKAHQAIGR